MRRTNITDGYIVWPDEVCYSHAKQTVHVYLNEAPTNRNVSLQVLNSITGRTVLLTKQLRTVGDLSTGIHYEVDFDAARAFQLLASLTPESVLAQTMYTATGSRPSNAETRTLTLTLGDGRKITQSCIVILGAIDASETRYPDKKRRIFTNFPQTVALTTKTPDGGIISGEDDIYPSHAGVGVLFEVAPLPLWNNDSYVQSLKNGETVEVILSDINHFTYGEWQEPQEEAHMEFIPDNRTKGTYLRWLRRDGTIGYWLFDTTKRIENIAASSFERYNPHGYPYNAQGSPYYGVISDSTQAAKTGATALSVGSGSLEAWEREYLRDILYAPRVERLLQNRPGNYIWEQVQISTTTYAEDTECHNHLQDFELTIILPKHSTITL